MKNCFLLFIFTLFVGLAGCSTKSVEPSAATQADATPTVAVTQTVALEVPKMACPFSCWPKVKETLETEPGVAEVTLSQQQEENVIDNHVVHVAANEAFDVEKAIADLAAAGFDGSTVAKP